VDRALEDSASSDATLRCFAPRCLREPYLRALAAPGGPSELLGRRLHFGEVVARYLTALLAADPIVRTRPPDGLLDLLGKLDRPTFGDWATAADHLAAAVAGVAGPLAPLAGVLRDARGRPTAARAALGALVEIRNRVAHGDGGLVPSREDATIRLEEATPALRTLTTALRVVVHLPIGCFDTYESDDWGRPVAQVVWFVGAEAIRVTQPLDRWGVPPRMPFVRDRDGRLHWLPPLLATAVFERKGETELRLLWRMRTGLPEYSAPDADAPAPPLDPAPVALHAHWGAPADWATRERPPLDVAVPSPSAPPGLPRRVGGYEVVGRLASGGSGTVFAARSAEGELVALKLLAHTAQPSATMRGRFEREAIILARVRHPAVVRVLGGGFDPSAGAYLALEYVDGRDLACLYGDRRAGLDEALDIARQLLACLGDVHAQGIVHRDVKPSNVLLDGRRRVRLVDFGIARDAQAAPLTSTLDALGTLAYAAPEQLAGGAVDGRTDLYGAGRLLGWLLTGEPGGRPRDLPGVAAFLRRLTAAVRDDRFASAAEALATLSALGDGTAGPPVGAGARLAGGYRVARLDGRLDDDIWQATAVETATGQPVGLAVAVAGSPGAGVLADAARRASADPAWRVETGYRALLEDDGLSLLIADGEQVAVLVAGARHDTAVQPVVSTKVPTPEAALLALPGVTRVDLETQTLGARDHVGRTSDGRALAVVRALDRLPAGNPVYDATVVRLASRAVTLLAPLIGITDGHRWLWLRRLGARQLVVVDDPADALARALNRR
jgi:hypothetical protein